MTLSVNSKAMSKTAEIWKRTLHSSKSNLAKRIHARLARNGPTPVEDLISWYCRVSHSTSTHPGNVYATLKALEEMGDIEWVEKTSARKGTVTHVSPCQVQ